MADLTRDAVVAALGSVDDALVVQILSTGASAEEFNQAVAWLTNDEAFINAGDPLAAGRVASVADLLEAAEEDSLPDADG
jgi:hypothetical protein